jgi:flagellar hook-basal body complex protein FliE
MSANFSMGAVQAIQSSIGIPETVLQSNIKPVQDAGPDRIDFKGLLNSAIKSVSDSQIDSDNMVAKLAAGQNVELHNVMLAAQKASLTLQLALQIKNKVTDAYSEIMKMSV